MQVFVFRVGKQGAARPQRVPSELLRRVLMELVVWMCRIEAPGIKEDGTATSLLEFVCAGVLLFLLGRRPRGASFLLAAAGLNTLHSFEKKTK